jgi:hypothetical protein
MSTSTLIILAFPAQYPPSVPPNTRPWLENVAMLPGSYDV